MKKSVILVLLFLCLSIGFASAVNVTLSDSGTLAQVNVVDAVDMFAYEVVLNYTGSIDTDSLGAVDYSAFSAFLGDSATYSYKLETGNKLYIYGSRLDATGSGVNGSGNLFNITHSAGDVGLWSLLSLSIEDINENLDGTAIGFVPESVPYCGDNSCNNGESCSSCAADCGSCPAASGGGGGSTTKTEYYSIKIVTPGDILVSDKNYIEVPLTISNNGLQDLNGINLKAEVTFDGQYSGDLQAILAKNRIEKIEAGKSEKFNVQINVNTKKFGRYRLTIYADVESPKISDFGDFYIELKKVEASDAEQTLIFAERLIAKNADCFELTEVIKEARRLYDEGDYRNSVVKLKEATDACSELVSRNEKSYINESAQTGLIYLIAILTLAILILGLIFYIYRRSRN